MVVEFISYMDLCIKRGHFTLCCKKPNTIAEDILIDAFKSLTSEDVEALSNNDSELVLGALRDWLIMRMKSYVALRARAVRSEVKLYNDTGKVDPQGGEDGFYSLIGSSSSSNFGTLYFTTGIHGV